MRRYDIVNFQAERNLTTVLFKDGSMLALFPDSVPAAIGRIPGGLDSVVLYQSGQLKAFATLQSEGVDPDRFGFFCYGRHTQQDLARYWTAAIDLANTLERERRRGHINEYIWITELSYLWDITRQDIGMRTALQRGELRVFQRDPGRFKQRVEKGTSLWATP